MSDIFTCTNDVRCENALNALKILTARQLGTKFALLKALMPHCKHAPAECMQIKINANEIYSYFFNCPPD